MLWKKESNKPDAVFVNIFAPCRKYLEDEFRRIDRQYTHPLPVKNDAIALQKRNEGNGHFRSQKWFFAIEMYKESLRFAKPRSEHVSLAYANRATCFLKLLMYDKCLKDIELAEEAGYPAYLMHKLESRKAECMKQLEEGAESRKIGGQLSYDADKSFPCMANVLKVQADNDGSYAVVAKQDIEVGQTVIVEDLLFPYALKRNGLQCHICTKRCENVVPCETCAIALLCPACKGHFLHKYECGLSFCGQSYYNNEIMTEVRRIFSITKMFASVDELMDFVKQIRNRPKKLPMSLKTDRDKYHAFFNLPSKDEKVKGLRHFLPLMIYPVYQTVLKVREMKAMFRSQKHLRFLMHLIGHHHLKQPSNARFGMVLQPVPGMPDDNDPMNFANGHHLMDRYMQHSCYPNVLSILTNGQNTLITARPVKKGEMLLESRILIKTESKQERQLQLRKELGGKCQCSRCREITATAAQRQQVSSDVACSSYGGKALVARMKLFVNHNPCDENDEAIVECGKILQKYGHFEWCEEIQRLLKDFMAALYIRVAGNLN